MALASTGNGIQAGKSTLDSETGVEGENSFLDKIEESTSLKRRNWRRKMASGTAMN
jgi:hypothetical protein